MSLISVIDYGMGNLRSVSKALQHIGAKGVEISADADRIYAADHVIFPGVGALADCMSELQRLEIDDVIRQCIKTKPMLGICLGLQALLENGEENGGCQGLGLVSGSVISFKNEDPQLKTPHMGWNQVHYSSQHPLWNGIDNHTRFYFVHSYYAKPTDNKVVVGETEHGIRFASAIAIDNVFATQFHPEKSQQAGLDLLENFIRWDGSS